MIIQYTVISHQEEILGEDIYHKFKCSHTYDNIKEAEDLVYSYLLKGINAGIIYEIVRNKEEGKVAESALA